MKKFLIVLLVLMLIISLAACKKAEQKPAEVDILKIGAITSLSGALQDYGECFQRGFLLGLEYMTKGTNIVAGRTLDIIWEDTTNSPDIAKERTLKLLERDKVGMVVGYASSGDAVACLPLFEEFKTICIMEPAAADALITKQNWNEYMFRTGRTSGQDALAMVSVLKKSHPDGKATIACFAPDTTYGYSMVDPFVVAAKAAGFTITQTEYAPQDATDFSPYFLRVKRTAPNYLYVAWAGANDPWNQMLELDLPGVGITILGGGHDLPRLRSMIPLGQIGGKGYCIYYPTVPQNEPLNDWLVKRHNEVYGFDPDLFTSGGFAAAVALCTTLDKTGGKTDADLLIKTMEGMEFNSPTGKRYFRVQDHQAMQDLYEVELTWVPGADHCIPKFLSVIGMDTITPPITNGR